MTTTTPSSVAVGKKNESSWSPTRPSTASSRSGPSATPAVTYLKIPTDDKTEHTSAMTADDSKSASSGRTSAETIRMAVLLTLVFQNSAEALFMRYSFKLTPDAGKDEGVTEAPQAASSTAVVLAEAIKLVVSLIIQLMNDRSFRRLGVTLHQDVWLRPLDVLKMAVPSCLYVVQNNLKYLAISNLEGPTFQLLYQLKILSTAIFSVVMLNRVLYLRQWGALVMLGVGVALVQMSSSATSAHDHSDSGEEHKAENALLGFAAVVLACCTSGFAGVYFEKVLKGSSTSLWVRNMQLSTFGILLGAACVWTKDGDAVARNGFFYGYNFTVWMSVLLNSLGGLIVAMVVKYADNVIKGFATSTSVVLTSLVSFVMFGFSISTTFCIGAYLVLQATFMYSSKQTPPKDKSESSSVLRKRDETELVESRKLQTEVEPDLSSKTNRSSIVV